MFFCLTSGMICIYYLYTPILYTNPKYIMLTEKQQYVLDVVTDFISRCGKSPTIDELMLLLKQKSKR